MRKNPERTANRRAEITTAARELFFEYGYDATSIRAIQDRVGKQVAVFYYYFDSKDEVFDAAIAQFMKTYENKLVEFVNKTHSSLTEDLESFLAFAEEQVHIMRRQHGNALHWSIVRSIQTSMIDLIRTCIRDLLDWYVDAGAPVTYALGLDETANVLAYSFGGSILFQKEESYKQQREDLLKLIPLLIQSNEQ